MVLKSALILLISIVHPWKNKERFDYIILVTGRISFVASSAWIAFFEGHFVDSIVVVGKLVIDMAIIVELVVGMKQLR